MMGGEGAVLLLREKCYAAMTSFTKLEHDLYMFETNVTWFHSPIAVDGLEYSSPDPADRDVSPKVFVVISTWRLRSAYIILTCITRRHRKFAEVYEEVRRAGDRQIAGHPPSTLGI